MLMGPFHFITVVHAPLHDDKGVATNVPDVSKPLPWILYTLSPLAGQHLKFNRSRSSSDA